MTALPNPCTVRVAFDTRAEAEAAFIMDGVDLIHVGALAYRANPLGNAMLTNGGARAWAPAGEIAFQHFAANAVPGTTPFNEAIGRLLVWLRASQNNETFTPGPVRRVSGLGERIAMTGPVYTAGLKYVDFVDAEFVAIGGAWPVWGGASDAFGRRVHAPGMWNLNTGLDMTRPQTTDVSFRNCTFNAAGLAAGFVNANDTRSQCGVIDCQGTGPRDYGVHLQPGQNSDFRVRGNRFRQFEFSDTARLDANNLTAVMVDVRSPDAKITGNTLSYCALPVYLGAYADVTGNHLFQGVDGVANLPSNQLPLIEVNSTGGLIADNYLDTGHVILRVRADAVATGHQVMLERNKFFLLEGTHPFVLQITTTQADTTLAGFTIKNNTVLRASGATLTTEAVMVATGAGGYVAADRMRHVAKDNHRSDLFRHIWRGLPDWEPVPFWGDGLTIETVEGIYAVKMQHTSNTTVTNATGGLLGQSLTVVCVNNRTTFAHNTGDPTGRFILPGGTNLTPAAGQVVLFTHDGTNWRHMATSA